MVLGGRSVGRHGDVIVRSSKAPNVKPVCANNSKGEELCSNPQWLGRSVTGLATRTSVASDAEDDVPGLSAHKIRNNG